jgi:primosomal protein N' (replication factor Y)
VLHSGLTAAQRHQQWMMIATGDSDIVLGTRSGIFAPFPEDSLGLIIIDEEHDSSYKQDQSPRYHARSAAIVRASINRCPIVLGSATPSMESWHNAATRDDWMLHSLKDRAPGLTTPIVRIIDRVQERRAMPHHRGSIGPTLHSALTRTLDEGRQALLLLNRRGWASYIACASPACGWMLRCDRCDASMVVHRVSQVHRLEFLRCHHCQQERRLPKVCDACGGRCTPLGSGTQRIESDLHRLDDRLAQPDAVVRVDSDTMRRSTDYHRVLGAFGAGKIRVLLGTQMIAKGLDFPGIGLVGVIDADTAINLPDFRAAERTYQLISQVAGRCGRSEDRGVAIVQTWNPDVPAIALAAKGVYAAFAKDELAQRKACGLPPMTRMARIVVRDQDESIALGQATVIAELCATHPTITVAGPSPCAMSKVADFYRFQVELTGSTASDLAAVLAAARRDGLLVPPARVAVDVDPIFLL